MPLATLLLYEGQLPVAKTALYTCPVGKRAIIKSISVHNASDAVRPFLLYIKRSTADSRCLVNIQHGARFTTEDDRVHTLEAGDAIEGQSPEGATIFDCVVGGTEEAITEPAP